MAQDIVAKIQAAAQARGIDQDVAWQPVSLLQYLGP